MKGKEGKPAALGRQPVTQPAAASLSCTPISWIVKAGIVLCLGKCSPHSVVLMEAEKTRHHEKAASAQTRFLAPAGANIQAWPAAGIEQTSNSPAPLCKGEASCFHGLEGCTLTPRAPRSRERAGRTPRGRERVRGIPSSLPHESSCLVGPHSLGVSGCLSVKLLFLTGRKGTTTALLYRWRN